MESVKSLLKELLRFKIILNEIPDFNTKEANVDFSVTLIIAPIHWFRVTLKPWIFLVYYFGAKIVNLIFHFVVFANQ